MMTLVQQYVQASGQKLKNAKTAIYFCKNSSREFQRFIASSVGISATKGYEKYLGLPTMVGRSKIQTFASIHSRVQKRLERRKKRFLSQAGNEILIKAVIQAIPMYSMSVFKLPKTLCKTLNSIISRFWWGYKQNSSRCAWIK
jgi:hypothetical protein